MAKLFHGINLIELDESNIKTLISEIETPVFGYPQKLIIIKNSGLFSKKGNKETEKEISSYLSKNEKYYKDSVYIIFIEQEINKNTLIAEIENHGIICNFEKLKPNEIAKRLLSIINAYKVKISQEDLNRFIEICGTNMQVLINEIRKLIEYVGPGGTITKKEMDLLSIKQLEYIIFDLTDNLGKKDVNKALEILHELIYNKEPVQKILITIYNHFKKLYIVNACIRLNMNIIQNLNLKPNQTFLVNKYKKQASYFKEKELKRIIKELINLDEKYKQGEIDLNIGLESILCAYCS